MQFTEPTQTDDFKNKVCLPYFNDIYEDLKERSDQKNLGVNKLSLIYYCQLPGLLSERLFKVLDNDNNNYLN